jgi:hypothetical protein
LFRHSVLHPSRKIRFRIKRGEQEYWIRPIETAIIEVTAVRDSIPPPVVPDGLGNWDYASPHAVLGPYKNDYSQACGTVVQRIENFFRFELHTPIDALPRSRVLEGEVWYNENRNVVGKHGGTILVARMPGTRGEMGVRPLTLENFEDLLAFLEKPRECALWEELFSDGQAAWYQGNYRRAVLDTAIGCELLIKRTLFPTDSLGATAFDYLEDRGAVRMRPLELLEGVCVEAFGKSFKKFDSEAFESLEELFRCRNKLAHRGEAIYADKQGKVHEAGAQAVERWWNSAMKMAQWLIELGDLQPSGG